MEFELFEPLEEITEEQCQTFNNELTREMPNGHVLKNEKFSCIAMRTGRDDYLFYIETLNKYAIVHLTWNPESNPIWPYTTLFNTLEEIRNSWDENFG